MATKTITKDDQYYLNHCTKYLSRGMVGPGPPGSPANLNEIAEAWRFPIVAPRGLTAGGQFTSETNEVTFIWDLTKGPALTDPPAVVGTFANLFEPVPLRRVLFLGEDTNYYAVTIEVPYGEVHYYKFRVNGQFVVDPINPQQATRDNKAVWSRFFTYSTLRPVVFQDWELRLLYRLTEQILPFRTEAAENFLDRHYASLSGNERRTTYRLDESVGEVNYIDKLVAREELHHLADYKICLRLIDQLLRQRNPFLEPAEMSKEIYIDLYDQMAGGNVPGWDYGQYGNPRYFLEMLRRHVVTAAFSHPKHGGNVGAAGWAYLSERYTDQNRATLFDWRRAVEPPLGTNADYHG